MYMEFKDDKYYMNKAIELAYIAKGKGDNPFGSILVDENGNIVTRAIEQENKLWLF